MKMGVRTAGPRPDSKLARCTLPTPRDRRRGTAVGSFASDSAPRLGTGGGTPP